MDDRPAVATYAAPIAVGALLVLYAIALLLMSGGEANPALVLLFGLLGVCAAGYGFYKRDRARN